MTRQPDARTSIRQQPSTRALQTLFERCSAGDRRAREEIIVGFLPYAHRLARHYRGRGEPLEDLCQSASVGLIKAVDRYDPKRSDTFIAFADPTIRGEIRRHFRDTTWRVHVPRSIQDHARRVADARERLRESGREPTTSAVAHHLGLSQDTVAKADAALGAHWAQSLDATPTTQDCERLSPRETIGEPDPNFERIETGLGWMQALRRLPTRDREVLVMRLGGGFTQSEIAGRIGVSQMHISRILRTATAVVAAALTPGRRTESAA